LSPPLPATIVVVTTFSGRPYESSWRALARNSEDGVFFPDPGRGLRNVVGGEAPLDDVDVLRDRFLGSAGECMNVSVVGVKSAVGTGGGDAGIEGSGSSEGLVRYDGAADDAFEGSRDSGALGLLVRELGVELVLHLSFHLRNVFLSPVPSFVALMVDCDAVSV
jgi:hypothetical protein